MSSDSHNISSSTPTNHQSSSAPQHANIIPSISSNSNTPQTVPSQYSQYSVPHYQYSQYSGYSQPQSQSSRPYDYSMTNSGYTQGQSTQSTASQQQQYGLPLYPNSQFSYSHHPQDNDYHQTGHQQAQQAQQYVQPFSSSSYSSYYPQQGYQSQPQATNSAQQPAYASAYRNYPSSSAYPLYSGYQRPGSTTSSLPLPPASSINPSSKPSVSSSTGSHSRNSSVNYPPVSPSVGQVQPPGIRPKITTTMWEDEKTLCYQVEANGVSVVRRADNSMINGTKLLNVAKMTRGRRDGILKSEKTRHVVKIGSMHLKGVWIPFERALAMAEREGIVDLLYPLFVKDIEKVIQQGTPTSQVGQLSLSSKPSLSAAPTSHTSAAGISAASQSGYSYPTSTPQQPGSSYYYNGYYGQQQPQSNSVAAPQSQYQTSYHYAGATSGQGADEK
ncbi:hypothetical protein OGAPHI_005658 [Ogataea philodendri]|uniref:HTH APSES-type domain-containing protein n=1 Tax=Ogataea philodendri TaxID=1378263 RepID=A0A9P8T263_9ASCO|nr:uncharacterized protein OGAPHI_005658 [Ogataea philodendri]KAH3662406.1 hypothetical protein OGAPHI_005658 [Ogataea philodendri]